MLALVLPPPVRPGDLVAAVAPSGPVAEDALLPGLAWVRDRYRVRATSRMFARRGYLAGDDAERARELGLALADPEVKAILAVRGGYGAMRLLDKVDLSVLADRPRWIVGFSDITVLHASAWAYGVGSIHAPHVGTLARALPRARASWLAALERPAARREWNGLTVVHPGAAAGPLVGGNLTLLFAMAASGRLALPKGAILAIEDVTESPYRVDRMLTALALGGHLRDVGGIVLGGFHRCGPGSDGVSVEEVLRERTARLGVPVLAGAPFGHGDANEAFVLGLPTRLEGGRMISGPVL
jgi:muramoyltetrapeptide carboxypeptidase